MTCWLDFVVMTAVDGVRDEAMRAFITSLSRLAPTAPTWCPGWSAHELTAHVTAAAAERDDRQTVMRECQPGTSPVWPIR